MPALPEDETDDDLDFTYRGRIAKERNVFMQEFQKFKQEQQWGAFMMTAGAMLFFLGAYTLIVPLYKVLCERWGFSTKTSEQEYVFKPEEMNVHRKWIVHFKSGVDDDLPWKFMPQ